MRQLLESGTLRNHAEAVLADAYSEAREHATDETELELANFPEVNPWTFAEILSEVA